MAAASQAALTLMRRPKKWPSSRRLNTAMALAKSTATVVVFMPPAVEPGEPPMSMSTMVTARARPLKAVRSAVLKPAVRGVMDWNRLISTRSPRGRPENSSKKNHTAGTTMSTAVVARMTLLCMR